MPIPIFATPSCGSCSDAKLVDFLNSLEKFYFKIVEHVKEKINIFNLVESLN